MIRIVFWVLTNQALETWLPAVPRVGDHVELPASEIDGHVKAVSWIVSPTDVSPAAGLKVHVIIDPAR